MPNLEDIRRFNDALIAVGKEPRVLADRGEPLEIPEPGEIGESGPAADLSALLNDVAETQEEATFDLDNASFEDIEPAEPVSEEETAPRESDFDLETFDFDTADYSDEETSERVPPENDREGLFQASEAAEGEPPEAPVNLFDTENQPFDFGSFEEDSTEAPQFEESEPEAGEEPEFPAEGMVFEAPEIGATEETEVPAFELPELDDSTFESGDFEEAEEVEQPVEPVEAFPEEETQQPAAEEPISLDFDEEDLSGLDIEMPSPKTGQPAEITRQAGEEDTIAPDETFQQPVLPAEDEDMGDLDVDEFNLGDFGAEFGLLEKAGEETESEEELNPAVDVTSAALPGFIGAAPVSDITLSDSEFSAVKRTLSLLPLNLKIGVEEIIGEGKGSEDQLRRLLQLLIDGATAQAIASLAGRILGKRIPVPRGYEKRTGVSFEMERRTFAYQFRENILPILRVFVLGSLVLAALVLLGYQYIYRPLYAESLYRRGYNAISDIQSSRPNDFFSHAVAVWPMKNWFFRYAASFSAHKHFILAEEKYDQLLQYYPFDKKGTLAYADFESVKRANYEKAASILNKYIDKKGNDPDILLAAGDNYMRWAEDDPSHYEDARRSYALIIDLYGPSNMLYMRMLRYFIRVDNQEQVLRLEHYFQSNKGIAIDPSVYAELGGYLLDKNRLQDVRDILFRALAANDRIPEIHYELARYYARVEDPSEEEKALKNARMLFGATQPLDRRQLSQYIDTYRRLGQLYYSLGEDIPAQEALTQGIQRYENAKQDGLLKPQADFGELYSILGNIYYYKAFDYKQALGAYQQALRNAYSSPDLHYKIGFIQYRNGDYENALKSFTSAAGTISTNRNLMYAMANALYMRKDYFAAEGYLADLLDRLRAQRQQIQNLTVSNDPAQLSLVDFLIRVSNNMGVTMYRLWQRTGRQQDYTNALVYLKDSTEEATNLNRNQNTGVRSAAVDLAFLNIRGMLYPKADFIPQIYKDLPIDMQSLATGAASSH